MNEIHGYKLMEDLVVKQTTLTCESHSWVDLVLDFFLLFQYLTSHVLYDKGGLRGREHFALHVKNPVLHGEVAFCHVE